jgi:hypothetical protein
MAVTAPKKPTRATKGTPPESPAATLTGGGITSKPSSSDQVALNFSVPAEFRKEYKLAATQNDMAMADVLKESFQLFKEKHGMQ